MRIRRSSFLWLPLTAALAAAPLHSQTTSTSVAGSVPTIKVDTRVVLLDVVVTNGKSETIPGLRKNDFQIVEEGAPQTISSFEEHKGGNPTQIKLPPMPPNVFTNFPTAKSADSVNVVLLDMLNTQPPDQISVREQMIKFLKNVEPGTRIAIFTLGSRLRLVRGFTTDFSGLSVALDDKKSGVHPEFSRLLPTPSQNADERWIIAAMLQNRASPEGIEAVRQFLAEEASDRVGSREELTLQAFQHLARYLSGIPVRKNLIWFSDSFPVSFFPDSKVHEARHQEHVQQTSDMLTAAQVAIYPVSAMGLVGDPSFDVSNLMGSRHEVERQLSTDQIAMEALAQETGGRAYYNTNGLSDAMTDAMKNGSHYYTLAYSPSNTTFDGKYRRIRVHLPNGDYRLAYRRGYYADKPGTGQIPNAEAPDDPLIPLIGFGMPNFYQVLYKIQVSPIMQQPEPDEERAGSNTELQAPFTRYGVDFAVSLTDLLLATMPDGLRHGHIEVMLVAYDREGKILNILKRQSKLAMKPDVYAAAEKSGLQVHAEIDVPNGDVYLRTGIFDLGSGSCGTLGIPLTTLTASKVARK